MKPRSSFIEDAVAHSAAGLVRDRWQQFLAADSATRATAFAAYVAALDLEAAAADALRDA